MRKLFILLGIMVTSLTLVGCTGDADAKTPPSYTGIKIEESNPLDGTEFVTFFRGKQDTVLVEVGIQNPDSLEIKSIVINGITYNSHRFAEGSTNTSVVFEMSVGTTLGNTVYSVDRINYLDGENTKVVEGFSNNLFQVYVFRDAPLVERENYNLTKDTIAIDFNIADNDDVITPGTLKALLYSGETLITEQVLTKGLVSVDFNSLLANKHYEVKVVASYDLLDNNGPQTNQVLYSGTYSTLANGLPSASIIDVTVSSNSVDFSIDFTDTDEVVVPSGLSVVIYNGETQLVGVDYTINIMGSTIGLSFDGLLNDNTYTIKVLADYDLNDGGGINEDNVLSAHTISTLPREVPEPALVNLNLLENSIEFDVFIDDPDGIIDQDSILAKLYIEDEIHTASVNDYHVDFQVNNLFANYSFKIELIADYDLNNGLGVQAGEVIYSETFSTLENAVPSVGINEIIVTQGYLTVLLDVLDGNSTLIGSLSAVLYEDDTEVQTINFDLNTTELVFDYATMAGVSYYVEIFADYNLRDGSGAKYDVSLRRIVSFTAEAKAPIAEIKNVTSDTSSITFDATVIDADSTIDVGTIMVYLFHEGLLINSASINPGDNTVTFVGLLSNNEYEIVVEADYDLDDGSGILQDQNLITHVVNTEVKETPTAEVDNQDSTDESIIFDVDIIDGDSVIIPGTIVAVLYHEDIEINSFVLAPSGNFDVEFVGLLSNNNYEVIIYVDYNLNDGVGLVEDQIIAEIDIATKEKDAPSAEFRYTFSDETTIIVDIFVTDDFDVITPGTLQAVLILDDAPAVGVLPIDLTKDLNTDITFDNLYSNERYYVDIIANYDLNDGEPEFIGEVLISDYVRTVGLDDINAYIDNIYSTIDSIIFDVEVLDLSGVLNGDLQAVLYLNDVEQQAIDIFVGPNPTVEFIGLDSETAYVVKIEADYNLNESSGVVLAGVLDEEEMSTLALSAPLATIYNFEPSYDSFVVDIDLDNADGTITANRLAVLYKDGSPDGQEVIIFDGLNNNVPFTGLQSDSLYEVKVIVDYDLNDEDGEQFGIELTNGTVNTLAKLVPTIEVSNLNITTDEVSFNFFLDDVHSVLVPGTVMATLYKDGTPQASKLIYTNTVTFGLNGFLADYDFDIVLTGNYDLSDGGGLVVGGDIETLSFTTLAYNAPTAVFEAVVVNQNTVDVTVDISDTDDTITGNLFAKLFDDSGSLVAIETIALNEGGNIIAFAQSLDYGHFYSIVIYADYNLLDGEGVHSDVILKEYLQTVYNKLLPQANITNEVLLEESITIDVDVYDTDAVITGGTTVAELYLDGVFQQTKPLPASSNPGIAFTTLLSGRDYEVRIVTGYDNGNGNLAITGYVMLSEIFTTVAKETPAATIIVDTNEATNLIFDIILDDASLVSSVRNAVLYDDDNNVVQSIGLSVDNNINVTFNNLLGSTEYRLDVEVTYNLNDGEGDVDAVISSSTQTTPTSSEPEGIIQGVFATTSEVTVLFDFDDVDNVTTVNNLQIYDEFGLVDTILITADGEGQSETFTSLDPNIDYTVKIESTYDLNDLNGVHTAEVLFQQDITTDTLIIIQNEVVDKKVNVLEVVINDFEEILVDATLITASLKQYNGEVFATYLVSHDAITTIDMTNLLSNSDYTLEFEATYDSGNGSETKVVYIHEFTTLELDVPEVTIPDVLYWVSAPNLTMTIAIGADLDGVANDTEWNASIYRNGVFVMTVDIDAVAGNPEGTSTIIVFTGVDHTDGDAYTVIVTADLDLNELDALDPDYGEVTTDMDSRTFIDALN